MPRSDRWVAGYLAVGAIALYILSGLGHSTVYDYDARLADALLQRRWWVEEAPPWLSELVPCGEGRWCVHLAPLPAFLVMPFLPFFSGGTAQTVASAVTGGLIAAPVYLSVRLLGAPRSLAVTTVVFTIAGTTLWLNASDGRAWYFAHAAAVLFASLAVYAALDGRPAWLVAGLLGAGALARLPLFLAAPALALLVARRRDEPLPRVLLHGAAALAPFVAAQIGYNLLRWDVPYDAGYVRLNQLEPFNTQGLFSIANVPRHVYAILMQAPDFVDGTVFFVRPSWIGTSLVLVSPAVFFAVAALGKWRQRPEVPLLALAAALALLPDVTFAAVGFAQFGYRYIHDAQAFLTPLVAIGAGWQAGAWQRPPWTFFALVAWSVLANLYGMLAIIHFGYVR
ncbi:MAG: hypothetical protein ACRDGT_03655 [Candidatus Limnocylindria bacterium]